MKKTNDHAEPTKVEREKNTKKTKMVVTLLFAQPPRLHVVKS